MSYVQRQAAHCDQCSHEWLVVRSSNPTHCAKCKSRKWNMAPIDSNQQFPPAPSIPQSLVKAAAALASAKRTHDAKSCRLYGCGMCAALKA